MKMYKSLYLLLAMTGLAACKQPKHEQKQTTEAQTMNIYFGDLHNHCNLTYGHGDMQDAFEAARQQLDFVSVTPHAMWPDIPGKNDPRLSWVIDYHVDAFKRLRESGWEKYVKMTNQYNKDGEFVTFLGYEMHSMKHGDHVALHYDLDASLVEAASVPDLKAKLKNRKAFVIPHHMGYQRGYRGYNWDFFAPDSQATPFVEIYSRHGLAEGDLGDYPNLHDMGPRNYEGTMLYGLNNGHKFGVVASTDQHAGYPGSYGDGLIAVIAPSNTRNDLWNAMQNRHVYALTGDKIKLDFRINQAIMGDVTRGQRRDINLKIEAQDFIDYVDIIKNGKRLSRINGYFSNDELNLRQNEPVKAKVKIEFGWNRDEAPINWKGRVQIDKGTINAITPCFRGAHYTAPQKDKLDKGIADRTLVNRVLDKNETSVTLDMYTVKNPNTLTPSTQAIILDVTMPLDGKISTEFGGKTYSHTMQELLNGTYSHFMVGWLSEAIQFHRAVPEKAYLMEYNLQDNSPEKDTDYYYVRVRQRNNQWAFSSAIWVEKD